MEWLSDNQWLGWLGLAIAFAAIEAATVDFVFVMLAGGALAASLAAALGAALAVQVIVAVLVGGLLVFGVRPIVKTRFLDSETDHGIGAAGLVGRSARVLQPVTETDGRVKLAGDTWTARTPAGGRVCEVGEEVRVIAIRGATAIVSSESVHPAS